MNQVRSLDKISTTSFPRPNELMFYYNKWAKTKMRREFLLSFLVIPKQALKKQPNKISEIDFNSFSFSKKNSLNDIKYDLKIHTFINWLLNQTSISSIEKVVRKEAYEQMFNSIVYQAMVTSRGHTHKLFGFGVYQLKDLIEQRVNDKDEIYPFNPIVLCPTRPECVDKLIDKGLTPELKKDLVHRAKYLHKQFRQIQKNAGMYKKMQKEILEKLDEEVGD